MAHAWTATKNDGQCQYVPIANEPALLPTYVEVTITHCGLCHTDWHLCANEWGLTHYPIVCGHEGVGVITAVGSAVQERKVGDRVGVGLIRETCGVCSACVRGDDNLCGSQKILPFTGPGCFADHVRVHVRSAFPIPDKLSSEDAAPLLCAGATVWAPLRRVNRPGAKVAVVGLGGLGHLAVQFASKLGLDVTVISTTKEKEKDAIAYGAHHFVLRNDSTAMGKLKGSFEAVLFTAAGGDLDQWLELLAMGGNVVMMGLPIGGGVVKVPMIPIVFGQKGVVGSYVAGSKDTMEMLHFASINNIRPTIEVWPFDKINEAMQRVSQNKARYRIVLKK